MKQSVKKNGSASLGARQGFTILELLVASLLLGMLMTILTMIFNQSSIAWRTGVAGVADLDEVRQNIAAVRDEADEVYVWNNETERLLSLWDEKGELRKRAISVDSESSERPSYLAGKFNDSTTLRDVTIISVGSGASAGRLKTYTVNVKSAGPDREHDTWDDIWSYPDEFE